MRIVLSKPIIFASNLTSAQAAAVLKAAVESPASKFYSFTWASGPGCNGNELQGHPKLANRAFIKNPKDFILEIEV